MAKTPTIHRLKVTLRTVKPPVWRRVEVDSTLTLSELAPLLEAAMGWLGGHLHGFEANGVHYEPPDPDGSFDSPFRRIVDERTVTLIEVLPTVKSKMRWDYDFGDGWQHDVVVEAIEPADPMALYPVCLTGRRACPPDDCGGPWGYEELLEALDDPDHERHSELTSWAPIHFDPTYFDAGEATDDMRSDRPIGLW
jgi:hypothetical protein